MRREPKTNVSIFSLAIALLVLAGIVGVITYGQQNFDADRSADPQHASESGGIVLQQVGIMQVTRSDSVLMPQRYTATVVARRTSQLAFQASERVDEILVDEGDYVTAGQLLAQQDQSALAAQFAGALARLKQNEAILAELDKGPRKETIQAARAELIQLKARSQRLKSDYRRQSSLQATGASSATEFEAAKFDAIAAQSAVDAAQQKLNELLAGTRQEQLAAQRAVLGINQATVAAAKTRLDQAKLYAPFAGRISRRFVDEGSLPPRATAILEIVESEHLEVRFGVPPTIAKQLQPGEPFSFTSGEDLIEGIIKQIQPKLERATRTQQITATVIDSKKSGLVDGQTVAAEFAIPSKQPGFWIPTESLQPQVRGLWSVLIVDREDDAKEGIAQRRDVEVLTTWGQWSRVRGTLEESEQVIVAGAARISAGQRVAIVEDKFELAFPWQEESVIQLPENSNRPLKSGPTRE